MKKINKPIEDVKAKRLNNIRARKNVKNKKKKRSCLPYILIILLFIIAVCAGLLFATSSLFDKHITPKKQTEKLLYASDKSIIMIMGIDEHIREDDAGRSDTLMVAMLDPNKDKMSLLSIPRDTRVYIPGYGYDKINAAYALGDKELTLETVEDFISTPIDHYIAIKTSQFCDIIDAIGGVEIDVEKRMYYEDPWDDNGGLVIDLHPGVQHMDGKTAITYVRYRDEEGDIGRIRRQQKFMKAVMNQALSPLIVTRLPSIIREVSEAIDTDLTIRQLLELAGSVRDASKNGLRTEMVDGVPMDIDEVNYWVPDLVQVRKSVADTLDIPITISMLSKMEKEREEYEKSIPPYATITGENEPIGYSRRKNYHGPAYVPENKVEEEEIAEEEAEKETGETAPSSIQSTSKIPTFSQKISKKNKKQKAVLEETREEEEAENESTEEDIREEEVKPSPPSKKENSPSSKTYKRIQPSPHTTPNMNMSGGKGK